jgi:phosphoribosylglycinamide formyltransferase-1
VLSAVVLISGGGSNLKALLEATENSDYPVKILAVGADNDASGLAHAEKYGVPSFVVSPRNFESRDAWAAELLASINNFQPDIIVLAGFMRILPPSFVRAVSPRMINTHPSLLPLFPGGHAVRDAMAAGAKETGVTIHIVDEGVDTGPHLAQAKVAVTPEDTEESLHERIKVVERQLLVQVVADIANGKIKLLADKA